MSDEQKSKTVEVEDAPEAKAPEQAPAPTREDLKARGWSAREMDAAEKRGMVSKPEEKKAEEPKAPAPEAPKAGASPEQKAPEAPAAKRPAGVPDMALTPEQEEKFKEIFPPGTPQNGLYFRMKSERAARQRAEQQREAERKRAEDLEARLKAAEAAKPPLAEDPDDQPLTVKRLKEMEEAREAEARKRAEETDARARRVLEAQKAQEEHVRGAVHQDFDETLKLAEQVMKDPSLVGDRWRQDKLMRLVQDLQVTAARADELAPDEWNAAFIAYEIGAMHPEHGRRPDGDGKPSKGPEAGARAPEQVRRAEENTQRRQPSASVPSGGGRRAVAASEVTVEQFLRMTREQRDRFRQEHPADYRRLRG